jgi:hypothetical protein
MTFTAQTGYHRPHPRGICQDHDFLLAVTQCDFDLTDPEFVAYFEGRTGVQLRKTGPYKNPRQRTPEEWESMVAEITSSNDMPILVLRGRLQDCWELYQSVEGSGEGREFHPAQREGSVLCNMLDDDLMIATASPGYV